MRSRLTRGTIAAAFLCLPATAALADPVEVELVGQVLAGQKPLVTVLARTDVRDVHLDLVRSGCAPTGVHERIGRIAAGRSGRFPLDQPAGRCHYEGTLTARIGGQEASMHLEFDAEVAEAPRVALAEGGLDLPARTVHLTFNRQADHARVVVRGDDGRSAGAADEPLGGAAAGEPFTARVPGAGTPLSIEVTVFDPDGLHGGLVLYPWFLEIPHEEVEFPTGSAQIPASQAGKLAESVARILIALHRVGGAAPLRLFVVGYTDTVGPREGNQALSEARARSIGLWLRAHGVHLPILTAGFGEEALAVATPDETPEARNRRAEYILAVEPPPIARTPRPPRWEELR